MEIRKIYIQTIIIMMAGFLCACGGKKQEEFSLSGTREGREDNDKKGRWEKGYDLPVDENERKEAEADLRAALELTGDIYQEADKGDASNVVLSEEVLIQLKEKLKTMGMPVAGSEPYQVMENWQEMERFLQDAGVGKAGTVLLYRIHGDGGIGRFQYQYDGENLYVLAANMTWGKDETPMPAYISYTRIKEWRYTEKGYFCYELCVPEPPEVSEIVDGSCLVRVRPLPEECREMSEKCVLPLGYQGNNLLCSNWDRERLGCGNYAPSFFGTSVPEVTQIRENEDGTFTLTVDAVCQMILCNDAVITHELTIRCLENGGIQHLGNQILDDGMRNIPEYQYRTGK